MTPNQRQSAFERLFTTLAKRRAERLGIAYVGTIRRLAPPPLPGEEPGTTLYYLNAVPVAGKGPSLVGLGATADAQLRKAEKWVSTGKGPAPVPAAAGKSRSLKRKV
jgi:hypothetical protein